MVSNVLEKVRSASLPLVTTAMVAVPTMFAFAADEVGVDLSTITTQAVNSLKTDMLVVITATTGVAVSLVGITVGISFLMKKLKGLKSQTA
jgi:hypothetical protein